MNENDDYTNRVRRWGPVRQAVQDAKSDLEINCPTWEKNHKTDSGWRPRTTPPVPNAWADSVISPLGTDPGTASRAYLVYVTTGHQTDKLYTSAIGSFVLYVTVDNIDCCKKTATLSFWMYNRMSRESFGRFADNPYFRKSRMDDQYMWWNWKEDLSYK
jgi:hypothetical protein